MRRSTSTPARAVAGLAIATSAAIALSGCTWFNPVEDEKPPVVAVDTLEIPASMVPTKGAADVSTVIVTGTDSLPWLIGGAAIAPGEGGVPTVWTSDDGTEWTDQVVDPDFEGSFSGELAGNDQVAALGGTGWRDGSIRSVVWVSDDRVSWTAVELPDDFADRYRLYEIVVMDDVVYAFADDAQGKAMGLRIDGTEVEQFEFPEVPEDELLYGTDLVAGEGALLLVAVTGPEGTSNPIVTYASDDGGESWDDAIELTDNLGYVGGTVWTGDEFVSTGGTPKSSEPGAPLVPSVWTSADGSSWTVETPASALEFGAERFSSSDAWFGRPLARDGIVTAVLAANNLAYSSLFERSADGAWSMLGQTNFNPSNGSGGSAVSTGDGSAIALVGESTYWRTGTVAGSWTDTAVLGERDSFFNVQQIVAGGEQNLLILSKSTFTVEADGSWRNASSIGLAEATEGTVSETSWEPERAAELNGVRLASDDSGAEVRIGSYFPPGGGVILAEGWYRATPQAEWVPLSGFEGSGATYFSAAAKTGDTWTAVGDYRESSNVGNPSHGVIWTSADGTNWTRASGEFGEGQLESMVEDVCTLPSGDTVAVGWAEQAGGEYRVAVWMPDDAGTWNRVDIGALGDSNGSAYYCAVGEDGLVVSATVSGRDTLQLSTDGVEWTEVFRADRGISIGEPVAVPGGFAASGSWSRDEFSGPVVWLSADGVEWSAISVDSNRSGATSRVAAFGDDLLVTMPSQIGHPVSVIRDIEKVIDEHTG